MSPSRMVRAILSGSVPSLRALATVQASASQMASGSLRWRSWRVWRHFQVCWWLLPVVLVLVMPSSWPRRSQFLNLASQSALRVPWSSAWSVNLAASASQSRLSLAASARCSGVGFQSPIFLARVTLSRFFKWFFLIRFCAQTYCAPDCAPTVVFLRP